MVQTWEYNLFYWRPDSNWTGETGDAGIMGMLLAKGAEGWELVTVNVHSSTAGDTQKFFFKRPAE
jgi:hypothetical protein